jgi:hypothetical protein
MGTDLIEGWLSSRVFDGETAVLVALVAGLAIKMAGYVSTMIGTTSAMYYAVRGTYRKYVGWKIRRAERHLKEQTALFQEMMAAEFDRLVRVTGQAPTVAPVTGPSQPPAVASCSASLDAQSPHWTARPCTRKDG